MTVMNIERKSSEKIESQSRGKRNWKVKTREGVVKIEKENGMSKQSKEE